MDAIYGVGGAVAIRSESQIDRYITVPNSVTTEHHEGPHASAKLLQKLGSTKTTRFSQSFVMVTPTNQPTSKSLPRTGSPQART